MKTEPFDLIVGTLFSGIGGPELALKNRAKKIGLKIKIAFQVEINEFRKQILRLRFPDTTLYSDVKNIDAETVEPVSVLIGGFPCQDVSRAGRKKGLEGQRSGLWFEMKRCIEEISPEFVIIENVPGLLDESKEKEGKGTVPMTIVTSNLCAIGYDCEWDVLSALDFGAPHIRERVILFAYKRKYGDILMNGRIFAGRYTTKKKSVRSNRVTWLTGGNREGFRAKMGIEVAGRRNTTHGLGNLTEQLSRVIFPTGTKGQHKQDVADSGRYAKWVRDNKYQVMLPAALKLRFEFQDIPEGCMNPNWFDIFHGFPSGWSDIENQDVSVDDYKENPWVGADDVKSRAEIAEWERDIPCIVPREDKHIPRLECVGDTIVPQMFSVMADVLKDSMNMNRFAKKIDSTPHVFARYSDKNKELFIHIAESLTGTPAPFTYPFPKTGFTRNGLFYRLSPLRKPTKKKTTKKSKSPPIKSFDCFFVKNKKGENRNE